ncbi:MAG: serine/threonine protein kinase, partial [Gammaproteobacteria bacterium]|nr:serine/threonine protein kinase [Gammaproteobacteria bacterium]
ALAHKNRIVHRDLKPHNVMIARDAEGQETPKLLDFGIAKAVETDEATLTSTGMVLGTPRYLSPEQAQGLSVDGRSDLYSLGIIFYEMLVGRVPFDDPSVPSLLVKHMAEPPRPPSELRPDVPPAIKSIVLRLLEKDPARRFQSAEDLSAALAALDPAVPVGNAPTLAAGTIPSPGLRALNAAAGVTITDERRAGVIDRRALDPAVPVGNAPTLARGTNPTPGLRAAIAAAGADDHRRAAAPSGGRPHPRRYPAGYLAYPAGLDDGPETGTACGHAEHEQARSRLARRRGGRARGQRRATALDAIKARSAAQDSGCRGPRRIGPAVHERARVSEVARTRGCCSAAQRAIPSLRGAEAGRKRAPGRRARGHDGARAARRADAARSASIRPSLTSTATTSSCRGSTAPATMVSTIARCEAPTASTASRAPSSASAALRSPPSATAPARLTSASGQS